MDTPFDKKSPRFRGGFPGKWWNLRGLNPRPLVRQTSGPSMTKGPDGAMILAHPFELTPNSTPVFSKQLNLDRESPAK